MDSSSIQRLDGNAFITTAIDAWWCKPLAFQTRVIVQFNRVLAGSGATADVVEFWSVPNGVVTEVVRKGTKFGRELLEPRFTVYGSVRFVTLSSFGNDKRAVVWNTGGVALPSPFYATWYRNDLGIATRKPVTPLLFWSSWPQSACSGH